MAELFAGTASKCHVSIDLTKLHVCTSQTMFKNLVTLVTGASSGLGKATAEYFAGKGARVVLCDVSTSNGAVVANAIGKNALYVPANVSSESDVTSLLEQTQKKFGKLNVIVNCHTAPSSFASPAYNFKTKKPHNLEDFQKILVATTAGTFNVVRLGVGLMAKNEPNPDGEKGVIINAVLATTSHPQSGQIANETANASIEAFTKVLAVEMATAGIRAVAIAHGNISDDNKTTAKRLGTPQNFAQLAHLIVTTPYINATTINLEG